MTDFFEKLNLRPGERRALVAVGLAVFVVVNLVWVWPRFGDWQRDQDRLAVIRKTIADQEVVIRQARTYTKLMAEFEGEAGIVLPEDQALVLMKAYESQARESGVNITGTSRSSNRTNENFVEQAQTIQVTSEEAALVDFLYKLGASGSAVRAKEISLRPDAPHYRLVGTITLAASFQRKINTRAPVPTASAPAATRPQTADAKAKAAPKPAITNRPPAAAITNKPPGRGSAPTGGTTNKSAMPKKS